MPGQPLDPSYIMQIGTGFWPSKVLLTAVEFNLFSVLGEQELTGEELGKALGMHPRGWFDFFDSLVALKLLERDGDGPSGRYRNTEQTAMFLSRNSPAYVGGIFEMLNTRLFGFWNDLGEALRTGQPQNEVKQTGKPLFEAVYADPDRLENFLEGMSGVQTGNFLALAGKFDFSEYETVCDVGGALALLSITLARRHRQLSFKSFDLPPVAPHARKKIEAAGLNDRIEVVTGNFLEDPVLPSAQIITMGNILHDWNEDIKKMLIGKVHDALPEGGVFIAIENVIDDARRRNAFGLMMSLNMLIEAGDAFDYTGEQFRQWCSEAGFKRFDLIPLAGPSSAAIAYK